ncbi:PDDEXK nuclease domain-containing protein [Lactococcus garvieae]|uniref:PDDEXK nuclease domain-containing protein n=1 Tax=Lactococcus garvieae TaxID=1363 RepID=UPI0038518710
MGCELERTERLRDEKATIGILLCAAKNDTLLKYAPPNDYQTIMTSEYKLILSSEE